MKTIVFDQCIVITSGEYIDQLDEMLTSYGIEHSFTLPHEAVFAKRPDALIILNFLEKDMMTTNLVVALFCNVYRKVDNEKLGEALAKIGNHFSPTKQTDNTVVF